MGPEARQRVSILAAYEVQIQIVKDGSLIGFILNPSKSFKDPSCYDFDSCGWQMTKRLSEVYAFSTGHTIDSELDWEVECGDKFIQASPF